MQRSHASPLVRETLRSPGRPLDRSIRDRFESHFGRDFSNVRVHSDAQAERSASAVGASAYTVGSHIVFGANRFAPTSPGGQRLLAHELSHTVQQRHAGTDIASARIGPQSSLLESEADVAADAAMSGRAAPVRGQATHSGSPVLQRQPESGSINARFNAVINSRDWDMAAHVLEAMTVADAGAALSALNSAARAQLRAAALRFDPSGTSRSFQQIEAAEHGSATTQQAQAAPAAAAAENIAALSNGEKLSRAWAFASPQIAPELRREIAALFSPASLVAMAAFAALYIASQLTPAGWVADAIALTLLSLSVLFLGMLAIDIARELWRFFAAINATSEDDLRASGQALARAIARGGIAIVIALLSKAIPRGGPPRPTATAELVAAGPGGIRVPVPVQAIQEVPAAIPRHLQTASYAVMVPPPSGGSNRSGGGGGNAGGGGSAGGGGPPRQRGPEVWDEISSELGLEPPGTGAARGGGVRGAIEDARAGGLVSQSGGAGTTDLALQPHGSASTSRNTLGVTGAEAQSGHVAPTSFVRGTSGYSRSGALTTLLDPVTHAAFDGYWKDWAMRQRRAGRTECTAGELQTVMLEAINRIPEMAQRTKNTLAWRLQMEFRELGLTSDSVLELPYRNIGPSSGP